MSQVETAVEEEYIEPFTLSPIEARVELPNGMFKLPRMTRSIMGKLREATDLYIRQIDNYFKSVQTDKDAVKDTMDLLQAAKNKACDAMLLPYATKNMESRK